MICLKKHYLLFIFFGYFHVNAQPVAKIRINLAAPAQVIENIGSSGCWYSEGIGKYWPAAKKEQIAKLLFSQEIDKNGKLEGIGLSSWRFNIGAGTLEQGDSSGIVDFNRRADCFLNPDGSYDWNKQVGQRFFLQKAHDYGVGTLIAFANSAPVQFTKNGLGYKTEKDYIANLRENSYTAYAEFLANVAKHFDSKGIHFDYLSPVNEPQWDWFKKYKEADQEGSPWTNPEIYKITSALNTALVNAKQKSKILITEAGMLNYLYGNSGKANKQIQTFYDVKSPLYVGAMSQVTKTIAGHSYFTETNNQTLIDTRKNLADTAKKYNVSFWQSEYSMLGDGFKEGLKGDRSPMDCAIFLSKVIHTDLTVANATAWQFWNAYEPGTAKRNTRYYLIALQPNADFKDGEFSITKNLWALGHYSRFVRPGMTRVAAESSDESAKNLLISAFKNQNNKIVIVITNTGTSTIPFELVINQRQRKQQGSVYETTAEEGVNMKLIIKGNLANQLSIKARSIQTIVLD